MTDSEGPWVNMSICSAHKRIAQWWIQGGNMGKKKIRLRIERFAAKIVFFIFLFFLRQETF